MVDEKQYFLHQITIKGKTNAKKDAKLIFKAKIKNLFLMAFFKEREKVKHIIKMIKY